MNDLAYSLRTLCQHAPDGSWATRHQRQSGLIAIAGELRQLGYKMPDARSLKPKHIQALLTHWRASGISDATMKNRLGWVRWWALRTGKPGLIPRDNAALGIGEKTTFKGPRAEATGASKRDALPERMQLAIRLQMAFGLRLEESLKFRAATADHRTYVTLQASWCKGNRTRAIPVTHERQRDLLDELHRVCGDGSLIPNGTSYIAFRKQLENATLAAGITNMHKHRHWYACWRYRTLSGVQAPAEGGPTHDQVTPAERARLDAVRLQVSQELGHNRIDVTDAYLGGRWPKKAATA
ncbi:phage integrase N-terminal domain-containing protein [Ancylobacter sp. VNQ12]|jgi:hypothetical protein|uniref:phage integrase N-terminal domain-containing protein n=1 Tax=Ancylobacter sp. VNQ12 TaxID=3400920 RepID=UPI003C007AC3